MLSKEGISIIVCCYNSADKLPETLAYLAKQRLTEVKNVELIIVDNNSNDLTSEIALQLWEKFGNPFSLTIVQEPKPGLSNARKKGIEIAANEYLIFCDDDNWLEESYLEVIKNHFDADKGLAIIGGAGIAVFENEKEPLWFNQFYQSYAVGKQAPTETHVNNVYGAGMAIKKTVFLDCYHKFGSLLLSDRKGKELSAGGDTEICLRARLLGHKILYTDKLIFKHYLTANRLTWTYVKKLHVGFAHSFVPINIYEKILNNESIGNFYWLEQSLFYYGRAFKYSLLSLKKVIAQPEFDSNIIRLQSWFVIAKDYLEYNFKLKKLYRQLKNERN